MLRTFSTRVKLNLSTCLPAPLRKFSAEEDGALAIIGIFTFVMIMFASGLAIDLMRSEVDRARLQSTVDRATLAAASTAEMDEATIVLRNYLAAAGLPEDAARVSGFQNDIFDGKLVTFEAESEVDSIFIGMLGQDSLIQPISAQAEQQYPQLEVSLVLDISGSMGWPISSTDSTAKIDSLKQEAVKFIQALLIGETQEETDELQRLTTISVIPYHGVVNLGPDLASIFPVSNQHDLSHCITFDAHHFSTTSLAAGQVIERLPHFDYDRHRRIMGYNAWGNPIWRTVDIEGGVRADGSREDGLRNEMCRNEPDTQNADGTFNNDGTPHVVAWSNDPAELTAAINSFEAGGWTAVDLGAKVGAMLLDPSMEPYLTQMTTTRRIGAANTDPTLVDPQFANLRPASFQETGVQKILVIMTDGENTNQYHLRADRRSGPSGVFVTSLSGALNLPGQGRRFSAAPDSEDWAQTPLYSQVQTLIDDAIGVDSQSYRDIDDINNSDLVFSVRNRGSGLPSNQHYYIPRLDRVSGYTGLQSEPWGGTNAYELSYEELFSIFPVPFVSDVLLSDPDGSCNSDGYNCSSTTRGIHQTAQFFRDAAYATHSGRPVDSNGVPLHTDLLPADENLIDLCTTAARDSGINVFTIAFATNNLAGRAMRDCAVAGGAGKASRYIQSDSDELEQAFSDILRAIGELRLTQ